MREADMETMMQRALPGVGSPLRVFPTTNAERMYALDEAWNARAWDTFDAYHDPDHVVVYWPERQSMPTRGGPDHRAEAEPLLPSVPDNKVKHPDRRDRYRERFAAAMAETGVDVLI